eukprot:TRINITY_DN5197_c0_g1_i2.p1 TRINITY_DN5197_c0_g1~~TRINITY_DN5197_c0_g1_i2.p1  ORF type:complete len:752 (-),score=129.31 TRINITY_DN5197_c0_g1_i2:190-2445(-)
MINCDEQGRQELQETLKGFLLVMEGVKIAVPSMEDGGFNDIYYEVAEKELVRKRFCQSYSETPVILSSDCLIPIIIRIMRNLISDNNNMYSTYMIQVFSELKEPLTKNDENQDDLISKEEKIFKDITRAQEKINSLQKTIKEIKKKCKGKVFKTQPEYQKAEKDLEIYSKAQLNFKQELEAIKTKKDQINLRCLQIVCGLLQTCEPNRKDPGISSLLGSFIGPLFKSENQEIKDVVLECLALYVFLDKKICMEYFKVFANVFEQYCMSEEASETRTSDLISLKAIFDFFLVHNLSNEEMIGDPEDINSMDPQTAIENLITVMCKGDIMVKTLCIEGFSRLLITGQLKNPVQVLALFLVLWNNSNLITDGGFEAIQLLTSFIKCYTGINFENLQNFEKSLEMFINMLLLLIHKNSNFNFVNYSMDYLDVTLLNMTKIGINILSYSMNKEKQNFTELMENSETICPQERFFLFLCKICVSGGNPQTQLKMMKIFEQLLTDGFFDFQEFVNSKVVIYTLLQYLNLVQNKLDENPAIKQRAFFEIGKMLNKKLNETDQNQDPMNQQQKKNRRMEEEEKNVVIFTNEEEEKQEQLQSLIESDMQTMKLDMQSFIKNLENNGVIIKNRKSGSKLEQTEIGLATINQQYSSLIGQETSNVQFAEEFNEEVVEIKAPNKKPQSKRDRNKVKCEKTKQEKEKETEETGKDKKNEKANRAAKNKFKSNLKSILQAKVEQVIEDSEESEGERKTRAGARKKK